MHEVAQETMLKVAYGAQYGLEPVDDCINHRLIWHELMFCFFVKKRCNKTGPEARQHQSEEDDQEGFVAHALSGKAVKIPYIITSSRVQHWKQRSCGGNTHYQDEKV